MIPRAHASVADEQDVGDATASSVGEHVPPTTEAADEPPPYVNRGLGRPLGEYASVVLAKAKKMTSAAERDGAGEEAEGIRRIISVCFCGASKGFLRVPRSSTIGCAATGADK